MTSKNKNESNFINFIDPFIEVIIKELIQSRIKDINDKDSLLINNQTNSDKLVDLPNMEKDKENPYIYEINLFILFKRKSISFIVEHWKFKIDISKAAKNELTDDSKQKIKRKLLTFFKSIKSLEKILPLNSLLKKSFNYSFKAQLFHKSNIEIIAEKEIVKEKKIMSLEAKDGKFLSIHLDVNYFSTNGIFTHEDNLKKCINYNEYYTEMYGNLSKLSKLNANNENANKTVNNYIPCNINDKNDSKEGNDLNDLSAIFEEVDKNELMFSNIVQSTIINNEGKTNKLDLKLIKNASSNKIDLNKLYEPCFENIEDIDFRKGLDEILNKDTLMKKEIASLNNVKDKYNTYFNKSKLLVDELYDGLEGNDFKDLIINYPKLEDGKKLIISNYMNDKKTEKNDEDKENEKTLLEDIKFDYLAIKKLLTN